MQLQPFTPGILITFLHILLAAQHSRHQAQAEGNLLGPGEHVIVAQNRYHPIEGGWQIRKVKTAVGARGFLLVKDHRVGFPLKTILNVQLLEQLAHVAIGAKENMEPGFVPIAILVLPGRHLAAKHVPGLHHHRGVARITEIFGARQAGKTSTGDDDTHFESTKCEDNLKGRACLKLANRVPPAANPWPTHVQSRPC